MAQPEDSASPPWILSSTTGEIRHVLLHAPVLEAELFADIYVGLIDSLPPSAQTTVLMEAGAAPHVEAWRRRLQDGSNVACITMPADKSLTVWARDPALAAVSADGRPFLLTTDAFDRRDDQAAPGQVAAALGLRTVAAGAALEGGDILIDDDGLLVGHDTLARMSGESDAARTRAFTAALARAEPNPRTIRAISSPFPVEPETDRQIELAGEAWTEITGFHAKPGTKQPIFHIDMFLTLTGVRQRGRPVVLVGDPSLAAALLGRRPHPAAGVRHFDAIAAQLAGWGYAVIRNPMPHIPMDVVAEKRRIWRFAPTNNVLIQKDAERGDIVWAPAFGHDHWPELAAVDDAMAEIWRDLGFEVRFTPKGLYLAENLGGLHCFANVLERRPVVI